MVRLIRIAAVLSHLYSVEPLFKRAISMSGTSIMLKPLPLPVTEMAYSSIMNALGLENASVEERIERLTTISAEELVEKTPMTVPLVPFLDGDIIPDTTTFAKLRSRDEPRTASTPSLKWCEELIPNQPSSLRRFGHSRRL